MKTTFAGFLLTVASLTAAELPLGLDVPLRFASREQIVDFMHRRSDAVHPHLGEGMSHFLVEVAPLKLGLPEDVRARLIVSAADGLSARQIMLLGFRLRLARVEQAVAEDTLADAEKLAVRIKSGRGQVIYLQELIRSLIPQTPNKAPEPTPGAVTPRATEGNSK